jgi:transketolase
MEQIKNDVVYAWHNVILVGNTTGIDYGSLGATHHAIEDLSLLRALPGLTVVTPADAGEAAAAVQALHALEAPAYLRLYRVKVTECLSAPGSFQLGKVRVMRRGQDCTVFTAGWLVGEALQAAELLSGSNIDVGVVNVSTLNPLDADGIAAVAGDTACCITVEEHAVQGGLGGAVCEILSERCPRPVLRLGFNGAFSKTGPVNELRAYYGLTVQGIMEAVQKALRQSATCLKSTVWRGGDSHNEQFGDHSR